MILDLYRSMLETANQSKKIPKYIEMTYHINANQSNAFWDNKALKHEHEMLLDEFESEGKSRYTKTLYGVKFAIQFEYNR